MVLLQDVRSVGTIHQRTVLMLSDPQSVTIATVPYSLARTGAGLGEGTFGHSDGLIKLKVAHSGTNQLRRVVRLDHAKVAADPLNSAVNLKYNMACYVVFQVPTVGYTVVQQKEVIDGFLTMITASSGALITKVLGGES